MTLTTLPPMPGDPSRKIIVGIDFGTTMSGVAYAQTARPEVQAVLSEWPDRKGAIGGITRCKVPTEVVYDGSNVRCGYQIKDSEKRFQWFKLALDPKQPLKTSHLKAAFPDPKGMAPTSDKMAGTLATDFLTWLQKTTLRVLTLKLGEGLVASTPIQYIITVPAIWSEAAKWKTWDIARKAGMGDQLRIISEPEAAVIYTLDIMDPHGLKVSDNFVLCDAGGGTVGLISYTIAALDPNVIIREAAPGSGDACGSTFLNRIFADYLNDLLGGIKDFGDDTLEEALSDFEDSVKRKFDGSDDDVSVSVPGMKNNSDKRIRRGKLMVSGQKMRRIFQPVISSIIALVQAQIKKTGKARAVLLVGGFGQSLYLRQCIAEAIDPSIEVMQPMDGQIAIAKGALIKGLAECAAGAPRTQIASRVARYCYGIAVNKPFISGTHPEDKKYWDAFEGHYRITVMVWFLETGQELKEDGPIKLSYYSTKLVARGPMTTRNSIIKLFDNAGDKPVPMYPGGEIKQLLTLEADLSSISRTEIPTKWGADYKEYYRLDYEIHVNHYSASTEYSLWYKGKCYGKVDAKYA